MRRNDFVMRLIEQFGVFVRKLLAARADGAGTEDLRDLLRSESVSLTGLELDALGDTPPEALVARFMMYQSQAPGRLYAAGRLLAEMAELELVEGNLLRARDLYLNGVRLLAFAASQVDDPDTREDFASVLRDLQEQAYRFPLDDAGEAEVSQLAHSSFRGGER